MERLRVILRITAVGFFLGIAFLACAVFLGILACTGYELLFAEAVILRAFGVFLLGLSLLEILYLLAVARIGLSAPAPQSLPVE